MYFSAVPLVPYPGKWPTPTGLCTNSARLCPTSRLLAYVTGQPHPRLRVVAAAQSSAPGFLPQEGMVRVDEDGNANAAIHAAVPHSRTLVYVGKAPPQGAPHQPLHSQCARGRQSLWLPSLGCVATRLVVASIMAPRPRRRHL